MPVSWARLRPFGYKAQTKSGSEQGLREQRHGALGVAAGCRRCGEHGLPEQRQAAAGVPVAAK
jgi:hypothetical protein